MRRDQLPREHYSQAILYREGEVIHIHLKIPEPTRTTAVFTRRWRRLLLYHDFLNFYWTAFTRIRRKIATWPELCESKQKYMYLQPSSYAIWRGYCKGLLIQVYPLLRYDKRDECNNSKIECNGETKNHDMTTGSNHNLIGTLNRKFI